MMSLEGTVQYVSSVRPCFLTSYRHMVNIEIGRIEHRQGLPSLISQPEQIRLFGTFCRGESVMRTDKRIRRSPVGPEVRLSAGDGGCGFWPQL